MTKACASYQKYLITGIRLKNSKKDPSNKDESFTTTKHDLLTIPFQRSR
jgi:hypothetical protein